MALVVHKYGGSSLANANSILNVARRIADISRLGNKIVAVVSAMGSSTDNLINLAYEVSTNPDPREMDVLLSTGELVSCTLLAMALRSLGEDAVSLSGSQAGIKTNKQYGKAMISSIEPKRIVAELEQNRIVIIAGYQGITENMDVTTLGRGASDLTAVAIAARIGSSRCEIYSDVDGIFTADPNLVPNAQIIDEIGFEEMLEMASYGAKMNPRSIELAMAYNMPILVASSFSQSKGTIIHQGDSMNNNVGELRNRVRGIATDNNVAKITISGVVDRPGIAAELFEPLADAGISVDIIVQNAGIHGTTDFTFTVESTDLTRAEQITKELSSRIVGSGVVSAPGLAKVSIVGTGMQDTPGYAAMMFRTLADHKINIDTISTSEIRITCIINSSHLEDAARSLHKAFELDDSEIK